MSTKSCIVCFSFFGQWESSEGDGRSNETNFKLATVNDPHSAGVQSGEKKSQNYSKYQKLKLKSDYKGIF